MTNFIYGQRAVWCATCHRAPGRCNCEPLAPLTPKLTSVDLRSLLICARAGVVRHKDTSYALTWDEGVGR